MARVLHGISIESLPEPGELKDDDQIIAYRNDTGKAYRSDVSALVMGDFLDKVYPVGAIYMSISPTPPETLFGGTWEQINDCFLLAAGSREVGEQGGSETVALTSSQLPGHTHSMPSHTHSIPKLSGTAASAGSHTHGLYYFQNYTQNGSNQSMFFSGGDHTVSGSNIMSSSGSHTHSVTTNTGTSGSTSGTSGSTGSGEEHDNMPPYMTVYMWQRIS